MLLNVQKSEKDKICMQHLQFRFEVFCMYSKLQVIHVNPTIMKLTKFQRKLMILYSYFKNKAVMRMFSQPSLAALPFVFPHTSAITVVVMHDELQYRLIQSVIMSEYISIIHHESTISLKKTPVLKPKWKCIALIFKQKMEILKIINGWELHGNLSSARVSTMQRSDSCNWNTQFPTHTR